MPDAPVKSLHRELPHHSASVERGARSCPANAKVVTSFAEPAVVSPLMRAKKEELGQKDVLDLNKTTIQLRNRESNKQLSVGPSFEPFGHLDQHSLEANPPFLSLISENSNPSLHGIYDHDDLFMQVFTWLKHEKYRRAVRKEKRKAAKAKARIKDFAEITTSNEPDQHTVSLERRDSVSSEGSIALEQLAGILQTAPSLKPNKDSPQKRRSLQGHALSSTIERHSFTSPDTTYLDSFDQLVPSCDVFLDNSKILTNNAGQVDFKKDDRVSGEMLGRNFQKERNAWAEFKYEIVRLSHTLKLKGWRLVSLNRSNEIHVERLSGALTNAVYVVSAPDKLPFPKKERCALPAPKNQPLKLLLRIYGPQAEHLIDREAELHILRRLSRKNIGPRMLGTFINGRFEEYLNAKALTPDELRDPDTSKQIAKRMRELHDGIDLSRSERAAGPFVWRNWDKWVDRCEQIVTWLDQQILENKAGPMLAPSDKWKKRGLICGAKWPVFRKLIESYRAWLEAQYGGKSNINKRLVFTHNDTHYGNILRLIPAGESPLLPPTNEHKRLTVIDFEYSEANVPGVEFANHFTEWCYNYHEPQSPHHCNTSYYPTMEEQCRFIRSYLTHNPTYKTSNSSASSSCASQESYLPSSRLATTLPTAERATSISTFVLDSRALGISHTSQEQEMQAERQTEEEAQLLLSETRIWRLAVSAKWVAWGIIQANIPGMPKFDAEEVATTNKKADVLDSAIYEVRNEAEAKRKKKTVDFDNGLKNENGANAVDKNANQSESQIGDEFDYLGYAQERAMFVWGDAVRMGFVELENLPEEVANKIKVVEY